MKNHATHKMSCMISKSLEQPAEEQPYFDAIEFQDALSGMILRALDGEDVLKECEGHDFLTGLMVDVVEHAKGDESPEVRACVSKKIPILMDEGYQQKQAIAISFKMCRENPHAYEKAKDVPKQDRKMSDEDLRQMGRDRLASIDGTKIPTISNTREVNLSTTEDHGLAATFLPSYARTIASPGREVKEIEEADRISKDGTSAGAKKGWDTRRRGTPPHMEKFTRQKAFDRVDEMASRVRSTVRDLDAAKTKLREIGQDPEDMRSLGAKAKEDLHDKIFIAETAAYEAAKLARYALSAMKGHPGIDEAKRDDLEGRMRDHAFGGVNTDKIEDFLYEMNEVSHLLEPEPTNKTAEGDTESLFGSVSPVDKAGTAEGVRRAWETRLGKKPPVEEEQPHGGEGIMAGRLREAMKPGFSDAIRGAWQEMMGGQRSLPKKPGSEPTRSPSSEPSPQRFQAVPIKEPGKKTGGAPKEVRYTARPIRGISQEEAERRPKPAYNPNDPIPKIPDIDLSDIPPPPNMEEVWGPRWRQDVAERETKRQAKAEADAKALDEFKAAKKWRIDMNAAQRRGDTKAVENLRANMPERIKMQRKSLMDKVLEVIERHGISKDGTSEGAKLGWETRRHGSSAEPGMWTRIAGIENATPEMLQGVRNAIRDLNNSAGWALEDLRTLDSGDSKYIREEFDLDFLGMRKAMIKSVDPTRKVVSSLRGHVGDRESSLDLYDRVLNRVDEALREEKKFGPDRKEIEESARLLFSIADDLANSLYLTTKKDISKEGTSEGAKKGWETRRKGGAVGSDANRNMGRMLDSSHHVGVVSHRIMGGLRAGSRPSSEDANEYAEAVSRAFKAAASLVPDDETEAAKVGVDGTDVWFANKKVEDLKQKISGGAAPKDIQEIMWDINRLVQDYCNGVANWAREKYNIE